MKSYATIGIVLCFFPMTWTSRQYAVMKSIGQIAFYEKTWTLTNDLSLKKYVENSLVLQNATNNLVRICGNLPHDTNIRKNVEENAMLAQKEINDILKHKRVKIGFWMRFDLSALKDILLVCGVISITHYIESMGFDELKEEQEKKDIDGNDEDKSYSK